MSVAAMYDNAVRLFTLRGIDWENDNIRVLLVGNGYKPSPGTDVSRADLGLNEVTPAGTYPSGGSALDSRSADQVDSEVRLTSDALEWTDFTGSFRYAVIYQDNGSRDEDRLVAYSDLGTQTLAGATVSLDFAAAGAVCVFAVAS